MTSGSLEDYPALPGLRQRYLHDIEGLSVRILEAGFETPGRPLVLLLHGFPELAWSWRKVMPMLAQAGYHVVAPDQRGYGGTTGWDARSDADVAGFRTHAYALDALRVVFALGYRSVAAVVGHDFGSMVAAYATLVRPDVFRSLMMVSFPFDGPPAIPFDDAGSALTSPRPSLAAELAALPRPRKDSMAFFASSGAEADMLHPPQGLHAFLRAYFHVKSADWSGNHPHPLASGSAAELATLPTYYIMDRALGMAATVAPDAPSPEQAAANTWLPDADLDIYVRAFWHTGFQGALNWFRCHTGAIGRGEIALFSGRTITVPTLFVSGVADWGSYRKPGALARLRETYPGLIGPTFIEGAGHWVQQEQPERFAALLIDFLSGHGADGK
ncbi:alpha/beta fold hydrolase [Methylobacterium sp. J-068]|uniref:alpha/beta fold hydrolase n=1 Tax=Methylobacterium sp. J-068 TaxID=2836649 RepID=UPI001FBBC659|nr:alpha/beta hydrolase [Methylobacterium sp. J-068]MCJ2032862.1 alpha/beta fold hydrolase [Methylobacterium sp. J-068]